MTNGNTPDLDLTPLLAQQIDIKAGDKHYLLDMNMPATLLHRCQRWWAMLQTSDLDASIDSEELDSKSVALVSEALHIDEAESKDLGSPARMRLLIFLAGAPFRIPTLTQLSKAVSDSSDISAEA